MVVRNDDSSSVYLFILEEDHEEDNRDGLVVSRHESLSYDYLRIFLYVQQGDENYGSRFNELFIGF